MAGFDSLVPPKIAGFDIAGAAGLGGASAGSAPMDVEGIYPIYQNRLRNWYQLEPYVFAFNSRSASKESDGNNTAKMSLPIAPSNLTVTTNFATNIITTLYGVVEEHSEIRYYDIVIQGTTGYAPRSVHPVGGAKPAAVAAIAKSLTYKRSSFVEKALINKKFAGGFAEQTLTSINVVARTIQQNSLWSSPENVNGLNNYTTGYLAFHNLYRLFHLYKKDAAGASALGLKQRKVHPLQFLNFKDNQKYDVVPRSFTLTRSSESPMLYNYSIVLRAYNLRGVDAVDPSKLAANKLKDLGLDGQSSSLFNNMSKLSSTAATVIGGLKSGKSVLGR